jgi:hypothetical protein
MRFYNKRKSPRHATLSPCLVKPIFSYKSYIPLRIINHSRGGFLLELDTSLQPGEYVDIRYTPGASENIGMPMMTNCYGLVRWCRRQDGLYGGRFGVGLELSRSLLLQGKRGFQI